MRLHKAKLAGLALAARLPGRIGAQAETRRLRRLRRAHAPAALAAMEAALARLEPGAICLDLGANVGAVTARLAAAGARVEAYEPDPWSFEQLRERVGSLPGVTLHRAAVGLTDGEARLVRLPDFEAAPATLSVGSRVAADGEGLPVRQVDLLRVLRELPGPAAIVKMDIEGAEVPILERLLGAPELSRIGALFVETQEVMMPELRPRIAALQARVAGIATPRVDLWWP